MTLPRTQTSESAPSALLLHRIFETIGIDHQATQAFLRLYPDGSHDLSDLFIRFSSDQLAFQCLIKEQLEAPHEISFSPSDGLRLSLLHQWFLLQAPHPYPWRRLTPKFRDELHRRRFVATSNSEVLTQTDALYSNEYTYAKISNFIPEDADDTFNLSSNDYDGEWDNPLSIATSDYDDTDTNGYSNVALSFNKGTNVSNDEDYGSCFCIDNASHITANNHAMDFECYIDGDSVFDTNLVNHHDELPFISASHHHSICSKVDYDSNRHTLDQITAVDENHSLILECTHHQNNTSQVIGFHGVHDPTSGTSLSHMGHGDNTGDTHNGTLDITSLFDANKHAENTTFCIQSTACAHHNTCAATDCVDNKPKMATRYLSAFKPRRHSVTSCCHSDFDIDVDPPYHTNKPTTTNCGSGRCRTDFIVDISSPNLSKAGTDNSRSDSETPFIKIFKNPGIGLSQASIDFISTCLFPDGFDDLQVFFDLYADDETELGKLLSPLLGFSDTRKIINLHQWYLQLIPTPCDWETFIMTFLSEFPLCNSTQLQPANANNCNPFSPSYTIPSGDSSFGPYWICSVDSDALLDTMTQQQRLNLALYVTIAPISKVKQESTWRSATYFDTGIKGVTVNTDICGITNHTIPLAMPNQAESNVNLTMSNSGKTPKPLNSGHNNLSKLEPSPTEETWLFSTHFVPGSSKGDDSCTTRATIPQNTTSKAQFQAIITFTGHFGLSSNNDTANKANQSGGTLLNPIIQFIGDETDIIPDCVFGHASASTFTNNGNIHSSLFSAYLIQVNNGDYAATSSADYESNLFLPGVAINYCTKHRQHSSEPHIIQLAQQYVGFIPSTINISNKASMCNVLSALEMAANHTAWHTNISPIFEWTLNRNTLTLTTMDLAINKNNFIHTFNTENGTNIAIKGYLHRDADHHSTIVPDNPFVSPSNNENVQLSVSSAPYLNRESNSRYATAFAAHDWIVFLPGKTIPLAQQHIGLITLSINTSNKAPLCNVLSALEMAANHTAWHTNIYFSFDWIPDRNNHILATMNSIFNNRDLIYHPAIAKGCTNITFDGCFHRDPTHHCTRVTNNHFVSPTFDSFGLHHETAQTINALESKMISVCATLPVQPCIPISFGFIPHKPSLPPNNTTGTNTVIVPDNIFPTHHPNIRNPTTFALWMETTSHQLTTAINNNKMENTTTFDSLVTTTKMDASTCDPHPTFEHQFPLTILKGNHTILCVYNFMRHTFIDGKDGRATATTTAFARVYNILQQEMNAFLTIG